MKTLCGLTMLFVSILVAGCGTTPKAGIEYCLNGKLITYGSKAELDATPTNMVRQIADNNDKYERLCGPK